MQQMFLSRIPKRAQEVLRQQAGNAQKCTVRCRSGIRFCSCVCGVATHVAAFDCGGFWCGLGWIPAVSLPLLLVSLFEKSERSSPPIVSAYGEEDVDKAHRSRI